MLECLGRWPSITYGRRGGVVKRWGRAFLPSFPGRAWERTARGSASKVRPKGGRPCTFGIRQAEPATRAFPGGAWERGRCVPSRPPHRGRHERLLQRLQLDGLDEIGVKRGLD